MNDTPSIGAPTQVRRLGWVFLIIAIVIGGNVLALLIFDALTDIVETGVLTAPDFAFDSLSLRPLGATGLALACFLFEIRLTGWERSSLRRILSGDCISTNTDLFYGVLTMSGLTPVLSVAFTFGLSFLAERAVSAEFTAILPLGQSLLLGFIVYGFWHSLWGYWHHRIMHSRWFWEAHKLHHAATRLSIFTTFRSHPIEFALNVPVRAAIVVVFAIEPLSVLAYSAIHAVIVLMHHSEADWGLPFIERNILVGARGHQIHHSTADVHQDKNFGYIVGWDKLFGTWFEPGAESLTFGTDDPEHMHNTGRFISEPFRVYLAWLKSLRPGALAAPD